MFTSLNHALRSRAQAVGLPKLGRRLLLFLSALLLVWGQALPGASLTLGQLPGTSSNSGSSYSLGWVELDSYDVFQVAAPSAALSQRRQHIQQNLQTIRDRYLQLQTPTANISIRQGDQEQPEVHINGQYLMTITEEDATLQGTTPAGLIRQLEQTIPATLAQAYEERQPEYRRRQFLLIGGALGLAIAAMVALAYSSGWLLRRAVRALGSSLDQDTMNDDQRHQLQDMRRRLLPLSQGFILAGTAVWAMGRFPETRNLQKELLSTLKIPIIIGIVVVIAYIGIRITYAIVDKLSAGLVDSSGFSSHYSRRTRLRISTLSSVIKNIANFIWIAVGFLVALSVTGMNLGLLLASVGIIGLAFSLAAQNLVKGAIQGFFVVLEDQFAIGDVVKIGDDAGMVEKLNLRITQLRDTAGRLITIPTSDLNRVANYSLHWSQADLKIPVHYNADINQMLAITRQVGEELQSDSDWGDLILDDPQILGVDDFGDSAVIIRVWIKTQPMKQWDISREYRRRFKLALEDADTEIPFPQRDVWLHSAEDLKLTLQGSLRQFGQGDDHNGNGKHPEVKTDAQPRNVPDDDGEEGDAE